MRLSDYAGGSRICDPTRRFPAAPARARRGRAGGRRRHPPSAAALAAPTAGHGTPREPAGASPPATPASTPSSAPRVDQLARPLTDAEAQQLLEEVTPGALDERHAAPVIAQAWAVLSGDMQRGGWSPAAAASSSRGARARRHDRPGRAGRRHHRVSAVTPAGYLDDAGRSTLRLARENGGWTVLSLDGGTIRWSRPAVRPVSRQARRYDRPRPTTGGHPQTRRSAFRRGRGHHQGDQ